MNDPELDWRLPFKPAPEGAKAAYRNMVLERVRPLVPHPAAQLLPAYFWTYRKLATRYLGRDWIKAREPEQWEWDIVWNKQRRETPNFAGWVHETHGGFSGKTMTDIEPYGWVGYDANFPPASDGWQVSPWSAYNQAASRPHPVARAYTYWQIGTWTLPNPDQSLAGSFAGYYAPPVNAPDPLFEWANQVKPRLNPNPEGMWRPIYAELVRNHVESQRGEQLPELLPESPPQKARLNEVAVSVGVGPNPGTPPRIHESAPPKSPNVKERKFIANARGPIVALFGALTEAGDFIDSLHDALPKRCRTGYYRLHGKGGKVFYKRRHGATMLQKLKDLWRCADHIDMNDALWNLAVNQLQDALIGKLGSKAQEGARDWLDRMGRPVGLGTGPAL